MAVLDQPEGALPPPPPPNLQQMIQNVPVLGGVVPFVQGLTPPGLVGAGDAFFGDQFQRDDGFGAFNKGIAAHLGGPSLTPDEQQAAANYGIGTVAGSQGIEGKAGQAATDLAKAAAKWTPKETTPGIWQLADETGNLRPGFVANDVLTPKGKLSVSGQQNAQKVADRINGVSTPAALPPVAPKAPSVIPTQAAADAVFGNANAAKVDAAVLAIPKDAASAFRKALRTDGTATLDPAAVDAALGKAGALINDENRALLVSQFTPKAARTNQITAALGYTKPAPEPVVPGFSQTAEQKIASRAAVTPEVPPSAEQVIADRVGAGAPPSGGEPPASIHPPGGGDPRPLPEDATTHLGDRIGGIARELFNLPRTVNIAGHLGVLRQMLPGMIDSVAQGKPGIAIEAVGSMARALKQSPEDFAAMRNGWLSELEKVGIGKNDMMIPDPHGGISAVEENMLGHFPQNVPIAGLPFQRTQQAYAAGIGSLRTKLALALAEQYKNIGQVEKGTGLVTNASKIGNRVEVLTGRGNLPGNLDNSDVAREVSNALSGILFGPRLLTSTFQQAVHTITGAKGIIGDLAHGRAIDPLEAAAVRSTLAFVGFGLGVMKVAQLAGYPIGTDVNKSDWGQITLPDGAKIDLWGAYRTNARTVAREIGYVNAATAHVGGAQVGKGPFAPNALSIGGDWLRGKANPPAGVALDYATGSTAIGDQPSLAPLNPIGSPPFAVETAKYAFGSGDASTPAGPGGLLGAFETAFTELGGSVQTPTLTPKRDALGRIDNGALPATPVTDAWANVKAQDPSFGDMRIPTRNITDGSSKIVLDDKELDRLRVLTGDARNTVMSQVVSAPLFQNATPQKQAKMLSGANTEAERQAKVTFGLERAKQATDDLTRTIGAKIGEQAASGSTATHMDYLTKLASQGSLTDVVKSALDDMRTQPDPLKGNYEPSVDEYLKGASLVDQYLKQPAFILGTPQDWNEIAAKGSQLSAVYATLQREADQKSTAQRKVTVQQLPDYPQYLKDLASAKTTSGRPISAFLQRDATINPNMVPLSRKNIEKDPLWGHFQAVAKKRDPYAIRQPAP